MGTGQATTPGSDLAGFLTSFPEEIAFSDDDPGTVIDRYLTPDVEYRNDGIVLDRERLIAHARPARRDATNLHTEVYETLVAGDRVAARYTLTAVMRKGQTLATEIYMFGQLAPDGRLRRIDQITRILPNR